MATLSLSAVEGAALTAVATVSAAGIAGEFGPLDPLYRFACLLGLAFSGFLGYTAYRSA